VRAPELEARRSLYEGFGNALGQAVELVVSPLLFLLAGAWLDGRLGTRPLCTVLLALAGLVGVAAKAYYRYAQRMAAEEEGKPWRR
jgi:hypothetical protein